MKLAAEFKEKTVPQMFPVLQKHVKDGRFIGSGGVSNFAAVFCLNMQTHCFDLETLLGGYSCIQPY